MPKIFVKALVEKVNGDGTLEVAVASDATLDRQGERILSSAWKLDNFKRNPVLQWAHRYDMPPLGKILDISVVGERLLFKPQFAVHIDDFAKKIFQMYKEGFLSAFSVGFAPNKAKEDNAWTDVELLEISAVPVPANPNALVMARSLGVDAFFKAEHGDVCDPSSPDFDPDKCDMEMSVKVEPEVIGDRVHVRVRNPERFVEDSFRTITLSEDDDIQAVIGRLKTDPNGASRVQKYTFGKDKWSIAEAVQWVRDHIEGQDDAEVGGKENPETPPETPPANPDEKEGRVLSRKNIVIFENAIDAMKSASSALRTLLDAVEEKDGTAEQKARSGSDADMVLKIVRHHLMRADGQILRIIKAKAEK